MVWNGKLKLKRKKYFFFFFIISCLNIIINCNDFFIFKKFILLKKFNERIYLVVFLFLFLSIYRIKLFDDLFIGNFTDRIDNKVFNKHNNFTIIYICNDTSPDIWIIKYNDKYGDYYMSEIIDWNILWWKECSL